MAEFDFPVTAGEATDGSFTYTAPTGDLYEWNGYSWVTPGSPASEDLNLKFVNIIGDNMTGDLTLGTDPAAPNITLSADGSSTFVGIINNNRMPREWGEVNSNGTKRTGTFASSTRTGIGNYSVVFNPPLPQVAYTVVASSTSASIRLVTVNQAAQTANGFDIVVGEVTAGGVGLADGSFSFVILYGIT